MVGKKLASGTIHELPANIEKSILSSQHTTSVWKELTPLARNEWICWITSAKKEETQEKRMKRMHEEIEEGKKRPCCWPGCPHHNKNNKKWFK